MEFKKVVDIYRADEAVLGQIFGECVNEAIEVLNERAAAIKSGFESDGSMNYDEWSKCKLTDNQLMMLTNLKDDVAQMGFSTDFESLNKAEASCLIDTVLIRSKAIGRLQDKKAQHEMDLAKMAKRSLASEETVKRWYRRIVDMWNRILSDDVVEVSEAIALKEWLLDHRRSEEEFAGLISCIDKVVEDGKIDNKEMFELYNEICKVINSLS